ncbi:MAG: ribokinase [Chloroflexi bacterium]|nr:ribokinase [Chloroflexota bacterium]
MPPHIVVFGSLNMDLVIQAPRHPRPGETLTGGPFRTIPGGKGANQAVAAARMGGQVTMIGAVGADGFGDELIANLAAAGVDTSRIDRSPEATGLALITVSESGENTIVLAPGANGTVSARTAWENEDVIAAADALLLQLEVPLSAVLAAVQIAGRHRVPVILNPAPARPLPVELLHHVSYLIPNEHEAALLAGLPTGAGEEATRAAAALREMGVGQVVVTLGERGALVYDVPGTSESAWHVASFPVQAVDTTAAGDAFLAAFAVALTEGKPPAEAARWGCAAGALACTVLGAQPSLPTRAAVEEMMHKEPVVLLTSLAPAGKMRNVCMLRETHG